MTAVANPDLQLLADLTYISLDRYHAMIEAGILNEDDTVELLNGKIVDISPIGRFHAVCVSNLAEFFIPKLSRLYRCRQEQPITILTGSEPEPDFVVATRHPHLYLDHHPYPEDIHLLIEVADQTLKRDQEAKLAIYARAGIQEYWILNLVERQLEIYTQPDNTLSIYKEGQTLQESAMLTDHPLAGTVPIKELLP